ncbi:hypothetical protein BDV93DRAFT_559387 [Ceratobasidium sp. AG-I]|nr:hypothetical protein BDV93DRAFT_559387 [Ceratobasidium sp. AG-I]
MPKTTWDDDEAQFLKQSVKEWESLRELYSGTRERPFVYAGAKESTRKEGSEIGNKTTTVRSLFKSEYSELVLARRDKVLEEDPTLDPLVAYNKALALEWEVFQTNNQEGLERLKASAKGLRSDAQGGIDQQTPEMQKRCLKFSQIPTFLTDVA